MKRTIIRSTQRETYPWGVVDHVTRAINLLQRKIYGKWLKTEFAPARPPDYIGEKAQQAIYALLTDDQPCMISRFGSGEMSIVFRTYARIQKGSAVKKLASILCGKLPPFWFDQSTRGGFIWGAGYFPDDIPALERFGRRVLEDCRQIDLLGSWLCGERILKKNYFPNGKIVSLADLSPFLTEKPWTLALQGRKILIIHPFEETIKNQYLKSQIKSIHRDARILPSFKLLTYKPVQSSAGNWPKEFPTWFDALEKMCEDISKIDFDIAIIGAGAYGMSLAAFIKNQLHRKAFHLGGATQLLFGINGRRWENKEKFKKDIITEDWVYSTERPPRFESLEKGCYW